MRVLLLTSGFPPTTGGAESYASVLAEGLTSRGHDVMVVTDRVAGTSLTADHDRLRVRRLSEYRELLTDPSKLPWEQMVFGLLPELARALAGWCPDVVVANNLETTVLGRIVASELDIPLVGSYHEHKPETEPFGRGKIALGYRSLAPDLVMAGSEYYRARAAKLLPPERIRLIHHGVDTELFHPSRDGGPFRRRYGMGDGEFLFVTVGRLKERKGHLGLVRAFARVEEPARLVIAGTVSSASTQYAGALEAEVDRLGVRGRVMIDREVDHSRVPDLLAAADTVAQPSLSEGLGLALLEAMSSGRPAVATRIGGFTEILAAGAAGPRAGLVELVDPDDAEGLAGALRRLRADAELRSRLGAAARAHVVKHFSQTVMIDRTEQVLHEVVG